jgi:hypothetical protein
MGEFIAITIIIYFWWFAYIAIEGLTSGAISDGSL